CSLVIASVRSALEKPASDAEGLLYMMHRLHADGTVIPCYIGKAGRHGRSGANISANWINVDCDEAKFARWGYNYAYHLGDLSAAVLPGHAASKVRPKYMKWAKYLFWDVPSQSPRPRHDMRFWCTIWGSGSESVWPEFSPRDLNKEPSS